VQGAGTRDEHKQIDNGCSASLALFFNRLTSVWTTFCWGVELALYGAFGGTGVGNPWSDSFGLWIRVIEVFGLVIPTWPPEAEARLGIRAGEEMAVGGGVDPSQPRRVWDHYGRAGILCVNGAITNYCTSGSSTRCRK